MPDESCRKCGGALELIRKCRLCRMPLDILCTNCANRIVNVAHVCIDQLTKLLTKNAWVTNA